MLEGNSCTCQPESYYTVSMWQASWKGSGGLFPKTAAGISKRRLTVAIFLFDCFFKGIHILAHLGSQLDNKIEVARQSVSSCLSVLLQLHEKQTSKGLSYSGPEFSAIPLMYTWVMSETLSGWIDLLENICKLHPGWELQEYPFKHFPTRLPQSIL